MHEAMVIETEHGDTDREMVCFWVFAETLMEP